MYLHFNSITYTAFINNHPALFSLCLHLLKADNRKWKNDFLVLTKNYCLRKSIFQTKNKLDNYYGDFAPSVSKVKECVTKFRCDRTGPRNTESSGYLIEFVTLEKKMHDTVLVESRLKVRAVVVFSKWLSRFLTIDQ